MAGDRIRLVPSDLHIAEAGIREAGRELTVFGRLCRNFICLTNDGSRFPPSLFWGMLESQPPTAPASEANSVS